MVGLTQSLRIAHPALTAASQVCYLCVRVLIQLEINYGQIAAALLRHLYN